MAYATRAQMISRFGEPQLIALTDRLPPLTGAIVDSVLDQALADASGEIDTYLAARYAVPLATVPEVIERICCQIAHYYLHAQVATPKVEADHKWATQLLRAIAAGDAAIGTTDAGATQAPAGDAVQFAAPQRVFARET